MKKHIDREAQQDIQSARTIGSIAEMVERADVNPKVQEACEKYAADYEKWSIGRGNYPSTSGIVGALMDAGIFNQ
jgi:hypothetical protein